MTLLKAFWIVWLSLSALNLYTQTPFSLAAPVEADWHDALIPLADGQIVSIAKTSGNELGKSAYLIEQRNMDLEVQWSVPFELSKYENVTEFLLLGDQVRVFVTEHNHDERVSRLKVRSVSLQGEAADVDTLLTYRIGEWLAGHEKGKVKQTFNNAICAKQTPHSVTPLEYRYEMEVSPSGEFIIFYRYNHSLPTLKAEVHLYNAQLEELAETQLNIDRGYTSYGFVVNDRGEVFLYKANRGGKVALVRYHMQDKTSDYLALEGGGISRENLMVHLLNDDQIVVAKLNKKEDYLAGLMYTVFDFQNMVVRAPMHHAVSSVFRTTVNHLQKEKGLNKFPPWTHYQLTDFRHTKQGEKVLILEQRDIHINGQVYDPSALDHPDQWQLAPIGLVEAGTLLIFKFNAEDELIWSNAIVKNQEVNHTEGLITAGYKVFEDSEGQLQFLYAETEKGFQLKDMHWVTLSGETGAYLDQKVLENPDKLVLLRPYADVDSSGDFIVVGKKGLAGKKTFIKRYKLN